VRTFFHPGEESKTMATVSPSQKPSPERIFGVLNSFQSSAALKTAIELDIFTAIADGADRAGSIAQRVNAAERGVRILCDYLTIHEFLTKNDGRYALTQESAIFLNRHSRAYMGTLADFLVSEAHQRNFNALTETVRKGGTTVAQGDNTKPNDELWVTFARTMAPLTTVSAGFVADLAGAKEGKKCKVLDIAAGHGMFGITIAKQNPNAHITAADWAPVLAVAKENAAAAGVADRVAFRPGSAFEADLGEGYDVVLLTNIFHHFDIATCEKLMRRVHSALKPGGKAITLEFVPNEDRVTPPMAAAFSLIMLAGTDSGDAYTFSQYAKMFENAGFVRTTQHTVPDSPQQLLLSEK
jgi:2-polyprenyl-3-methyl-5-hydroxy-6-metoxy-1,4-benzoquinol methylase